MQAPERHYPVIGPWISAVGDWVRRYRLKRHTQLLFDTSDQQELIEIAMGIGISPLDLARVAAQGPDIGKLLLRRMAALHLDPAATAALKPRVMTDIQRWCSTCASQRQCKRDLDHDPDNTVCGHYCPNVSTLDALQRGASSTH